MLYNDAVTVLWQCTVLHKAVSAYRGDVTLNSFLLQIAFDTTMPENIVVIDTDFSASLYKDERAKCKKRPRDESGTESESQDEGIDTQQSHQSGQYLLGLLTIRVDC